MLESQEQLVFKKIQRYVRYKLLTVQRVEMEVQFTKTQVVAQA